jgi:hypothetical protein
VIAGKQARDSAIRRLDTARAEATRLDALCNAAAGTRAEPLAQHRLSAGHADVASREQWLHWIEEGASLEPWADGEWGQATARERVPRSRLELAEAVARSAKRVKALERVTEVATARHKRAQKPGHRSAQKDRSHNA